MSAVFAAGAHVMRTFLRETKPVSNGRKTGDLGGFERIETKNSSR